MLYHIILYCIMLYYIILLLGISFGGLVAPANSRICPRSTGKHPAATTIVKGGISAITQTSLDFLKHNGFSEVHGGEPFFKHNFSLY